jgi:uncharacterized membrane protein YedE/YeeE
VRLAICVAVTLIALALLGSLGARLGGAPKTPATVRAVLWGSAAMAITAGTGLLIGIPVATIVRAGVLARPSSVATSGRLGVLQSPADALYELRRAWVTGQVDRDDPFVHHGPWLFAGDRVGLYR